LKQKNKTAKEGLLLNCKMQLTTVLFTDTFSAKTVPYSPYEDNANLQGCCEADMTLFYRKKYDVKRREKSS